MIFNLCCIIIIFTSIIIIVVLLEKMKLINIKKIDTFFQPNVYQMRVGKVDNLKLLKFNDTDGENGKIYVGRDRNLTEAGDELRSLFTNVTTNNTIFIKNGIKLKKRTDANEVDLNIEKLRVINGIPKHFNEKICIGNTCINKHNLKMLKGKTPFSINTFVKLRPFTTFTEKNYTGSFMNYPNYKQPDTVIEGSGIKSFKISNNKFGLLGFPEKVFKGNSYLFTEDTPDITNIFADGIKSFIPKSANGVDIDAFCLAEENIGIGGTHPNTVIQPVPCDVAGRDGGTSLFYILREDVIDRPHSHGDKQIHFHEHEYGVEPH